MADHRGHLHKTETHQDECWTRVYGNDVKSLFISAPTGHSMVHKWNYMYSFQEGKQMIFMKHPPHFDSDHLIVIKWDFSMF